MVKTPRTEQTERESRQEGHVLTEESPAKLWVNETEEVMSKYQNDASSCAAFDQDNKNLVAPKQYSSVQMEMQHRVPNNMFNDGKNQKIVMHTEVK